jgi:hypothetical protein
LISLKIYFGKKLESLRPGTSSSRDSRPNTSIRPLSSMRPLSSFRLKTALNRPNSRLTTSNSSGGLMSNGSSRLNTTQSFNNRPSSDSAFDPMNDASQLTMGPSIQGNPLKALLNRKKSRITTPDSANSSQIDLKKISDKKIPPYNVNDSRDIQDESQNKIDRTKNENKELRDEIQKWKKDHAQ